MTTETSQLTELISKIINNAQKKDKPFTVEFNRGISVRLDNRDAFIESLDHFDMTSTDYDVKFHDLIDILLYEDGLLNHFEEQDDMDLYITDNIREIWESITSDVKMNVKNAFQRYMAKHMTSVIALLKNGVLSEDIPEEMEKYGSCLRESFEKLYYVVMRCNDEVEQDLINVYKKMILSDLGTFVCDNLL